MSKNLLVAQSGGPTAAINATLAGVLSAGLESGQIGKLYGGLNGIKGILERKIIRLDNQLNGQAGLDLLAATPAMALGSCRLKLQPEEITPDVYATIDEIFDALDIGYFFYIGGNDSMDTVVKLSDYFAGKGKDIRLIGVPKTIDNDLDNTDHTPGFGSAVKYVVTSLIEVYNDAKVYGDKSVVIVEIMGRDAGWLTASSGLARLTGIPAPHLIYLPEIPFEPKQFIESMNQKIKEHGTVVVAVSEGIRLADGSYAHISAQSSVTDAFGHHALSGAGRYLEMVIEKEIGCKVRSVELSVLQRAAAHYASKTDLDEGRMVGREAVSLALEGKTGVMAAIQRASSKPYRTKVVPVDIRLAANTVKPFPAGWLREDHALSEEAIEYFLPLIQGEAVNATENGLPKYFRFDEKQLAL